MYVITKDNPNYFKLVRLIHGINEESFLEKIQYLVVENSSKRFIDLIFKEDRCKLLFRCCAADDLYNKLYFVARNMNTHTLFNWISDSIPLPLILTQRLYANINPIVQMYYDPVLFEYQIESINRHVQNENIVFYEWNL